MHRSLDVIQIQLSRMKICMRTSICPVAIQFNSANNQLLLLLNGATNK